MPLPVSIVLPDESPRAMRVIRPPTCRRGFEYTGLSHKAGNDRLRFVTLRPIRILCLDALPGKDVLSFRDGEGHEVLRVDSMGFTLASHFKWNGCSPKRWVPVFGWIGTPDFHPATIAASALHDCLYQFNRVAGFPWTREQCDDVFRQIIASYGEDKLASVYHFAVRHLGAWDTKKKPELSMIAL